MSELDIKELDVRAITVLRLAGKVTIGEGVLTLRNNIDRLLAEGKKKIVLNIASVSYVDSSGGPELLVTSWSKIHAAGGAVVFCNLSPKYMTYFLLIK